MRTVRNGAGVVLCRPVVTLQEPEDKERNGALDVMGSQRAKVFNNRAGTWLTRLRIARLSAGPSQASLVFSLCSSSPTCHECAKISCRYGILCFQVELKRWAYDFCAENPTYWRPLCSGNTGFRQREYFSYTKVEA